MKDFDAARLGRKQAERLFTIGGEQFCARAGVRPEALAKFEAVTDSEKTEDTIKALDDFILSMIEPTNDAAARWHRIRADEDDVIDLRDIRELANWLIGAVTGVVPTSEPSGSPDGAPQPAMDASSSQLALSEGTTSVPAMT